GARVEHAGVAVDIDLAGVGCQPQAAVAVAHGDGAGVGADVHLAIVHAEHAQPAGVEPHAHAHALRQRGRQPQVAGPAHQFARPLHGDADLVAVLLHLQIGALRALAAQGAFWRLTWLERRSGPAGRAWVGSD